MTKYETITPVELKKIMKVSIAIKEELGFYVSLTANYIEIDKFKNLCADNVKIFVFGDNDLKPILNLVKAYSRLFKRNLSLR